MEMSNHMDSFRLKISIHQSSDSLTTKHEGGLREVFCFKSAFAIQTTNVCMVDSQAEPYSSYTYCDNLYIVWNKRVTRDGLFPEGGLKWFSSQKEDVFW